MNSKKFFARSSTLSKRMINLMACLSMLVLSAASFSQPQPVAISRQALQIAPNPSKSAQEQPWNLRRFFEMENPKQAAQALREHAQRHGISLDTIQPSAQVRPGVNEPQGFKPEVTVGLIHLFNDTEFIPTTGMEDPLRKLVARLTAESKGDEKLVCILQLQGKMTLGDIIALLEAGVKIYEQMGRNTYPVRLPASSVVLLESRPYVRWLGEYNPEYKYAAVPSTSMKSGAFIYSMDGDRPEYRADLQRLGITVRHYDSVARFYEVILEVSRFKEVAEKLWWVKGVSKEPEETLHAQSYQQQDLNYEPDDSREIINAFATSLTGQGVRVGVHDTGIWHGNTLDFPTGSYDDYGDHGDTHGHGTHVCGIIAARGGRDIEGEHNAKGVAPDATLYVISGVGDTGGKYSYSDAFTYFRDNQVQISNHSYGFTDGSTDQYDYDTDTENIDGYADNDDMVIVFSAGNDANARTVGNPATGKNVISVGAINYVEDDFRVSDIGDRAAYSSQGPTADDSRLKPDLVAPGGQGGWCGNGGDNGVVSTNNSSDSSTCTWPTSAWYTRKSGTSMAAPHVTGVCAKMQRQNASSEFFKAKLINTTIPIKENSSDPLAGYANTQVGYGLVNGFSVTHYYQGEVNPLPGAEDWVTEDDQDDEWNITVSSGAKKLVVTLAYNDLKGEESDTDVLKDDLDLILISPSGIDYKAYQHKADGVTDESPLEKMVIANPSSGTWTVKVRFSDGPGFPAHDPLGLIYAQQRYCVFAEEILKTPSLSLTVPENQTSIIVQPQGLFGINPTVSNDGGYIAVGVTLKISGPNAPGYFGGDIMETWYVGNLMYQGASASHLFMLQAPSTPGVYTLTVEANGINKEFDDPAYPKTREITVEVLGPDTYEPDDTYQQAKPIAFCTPQSHTFHHGGERDYVKFEAIAGLAYSIETAFLSSGMDTDLSLYDTDGTTLLAYDNDGGGGRASRIVWQAPANGTYYVKVEAYDDEIGRYRVWVNIESVPLDAYEPDNTYPQATLIATNGTLQSHTFHAQNEIDYVKFIATLGKVYKIETSNLSSCPEVMDTEIWLYATDGTTELAYDDEGGINHGSKIVWTAPANGTYYVKIRAYEDEIGWYDISVTDQASLPSLSINDVTVTEGNSGTVNATFTVSLSASSSQQVTVNYATANGSATAGTDYVAGSGIVTFASGSTSKTINVSVIGDLIDEPNETFFVNLSNAANATISDNQGQGTIIDNDSPITIFFDNFENGINGWAYNSPWAQTTISSYSPTHSWTDSPNGNYGNNVNIAIWSPAFNLSNSKAATLTFWHRYDLESSYDFGRVWVTTDNGATYTRLASFTGTQSSWIQSTVNLNAFVGKPSVKLVFQIFSDGSVTMDGWYIDDVKVTSGSTGANLMRNSIATEAPNLPKSFNLSENFPNPFNPSTTIRYSIPTKADADIRILEPGEKENESCECESELVRVTLHVYDVLGQLVKVLVDEDKKPGSYAVQWDGTNAKSQRVGSGVYIYTLAAGNLKATKRMTMLK